MYSSQINSSQREINLYKGREQEKSQRSLPNICEQYDKILQVLVSMNYGLDKLAVFHTSKFLEFPFLLYVLQTSMCYTSGAQPFGPTSQTGSAKSVCRLDPASAPNLAWAPSGCMEEEEGVQAGPNAASQGKGAWPTPVERGCGPAWWGGTGGRWGMGRSQLSPRGREGSMTSTWSKSREAWPSPL